MNFLQKQKERRNNPKQTVPLAEPEISKAETKPAPALTQSLKPKSKTKPKA